MTDEGLLSGLCVEAVDWLLLISTLFRSDLSSRALWSNRLPLQCWVFPVAYTWLLVRGSVWSGFTQGGGGGGVRSIQYIHL